MDHLIKDADGNEDFEEYHWRKDDYDSPI